MKKVLFIAYHFPPIAGGGTFRSLKFVKYLPECGWLPTVITTNTKTSWAYDNELLKEIPPEVKIIRAPELNLFYLHVILSKIGLGKLYRRFKDRWFIPDDKIGWLPFAYYQGRKELKKQHYDLIFSTSPTPCAHLIAMRLKKRFCLPWVADYRDHWTLNPEYPFAFQTHRAIRERQTEKQWHSEADQIIVVTHGNATDIHTHFQIDSGKINLIYNGFDNVTRSNEPFPSVDPLFRLLYSGTFYGNRNPDVILRALSLLIQEMPELTNRIKMHFIGKSDYDIQRKSLQYGISSCVEYLPYLSRSELTTYYDLCAALLFIIPSDQSHVITSKLFDYLALCKPILSLIPDGEAKQILQTSNLGFFADPNSPEDIKNQILHLYHLWQTGRLAVNPNLDFIQQFHRRQLTESLAYIFNQTLNQRL